MTHHSRPDRVPPKGFAEYVAHGNVEEFRVISLEECAKRMSAMHDKQFSKKDVERIEKRALIHLVKSARKMGLI